MHTYVEPVPEPEPVPVPTPVEPTPEPEPENRDYDKRGLETPYGNSCTTDDQCQSDEFTGYICGRLYKNRVF